LEGPKCRYFLARVIMTPNYDRIAVVKVDTEFENSGMIYKRPDWTNFGFGNGGPRYPEELHSAHAEEHRLPESPRHPISSRQ
jgi:hypothetical protein